MITRLKIGAGGFVDHTTGGQGQQLVVEIDVIDPPAPVPLPGPAAVVPPAPVAAVGLEHPERIVQSLAEHGLQGLPLRFTGHDAAGLPLWFGQIPILRPDIEVAHHAEGIALFGLRGQVPAQAAQPLQLVGVLVAAQGTAVRHIQIEHPHPFDHGADHPLLVVEPLRLLIPRQQGTESDLHILQRQAAEDRHAVVGLLAADRARVAQIQEGLVGIQGVVHLGLLEAEHLRSFLLQPGQHLAEARPHRIHVPAGDAHG